MTALYSTVQLRGSANTIVALHGQSNALGSGSDPVPVKAVEGTFYLKGIVETNYGHAGGVSCSVETLLAPNRTLLKRAVGGTSVQQWLDTYQPLALADAVTAGVTPTVTIWIQGEADCKNLTDVNAYIAKLTTLFSNFESAWGSQLFIIPLLSGLPVGTYPNMTDWNSAITTFAAGRSDVLLIETSDLEKRVDEVHYSRNGYDALARRIRAELVSRGL